jgi:exonuclease VII small subunit
LFSLASNAILLSREEVRNFSAQFEPFSFQELQGGSRVAVLQIDADQVQSVANQLATIAQNIEQANTNLRAQFSALQAAVHWTHVGAEDQLQQAQQQLANIENLLKDAQQRLVQVVNDARQTEAAITSS